MREFFAFFADAALRPASTLDTAFALTGIVLGGPAGKLEAGNDASCLGSAEHDVSAIQLSQVSHDREAEAEPGNVRVTPDPAGQDRLTCLFIDARTIVFDADG